MDPSGILELNTFYRGIYLTLDTVLPAWLAYFVAGLTLMVLVVSIFMLILTLFTWVERRLLGRFQSRIGPNRWGPFGILQPIADAIKLLTKEDTMPQGADRWVFNAAPIVMFVPLILMVGVIPVAKNIYITDLNIGVLFLVAVTGLSTIGIFMAGWASGNRYALFGAARAVAMLISYEIPMVVTLATVVLLAGSMSLNTIVHEQNVPYLLVQPLAFVIFVIAASAEMNRSPFDLVEAESEIVAGYHTEYSGMKFALTYLAEAGAVIVNGGIAATLFLQGWRWAALPSPLWFLLKVAFIVFVFVWVRATLPRMRIDQIMAFAWKFLLPLSLVALFVTALEVYLLRGPDGSLSTGALWAMVPINIVVTLVALVGMANLMGHRLYSITPRVRRLFTETPVGSQAVEAR